jgi:hypothetical protein
LNLNVPPRGCRIWLAVRNFRPAGLPGGTGDAAGTRDSRHAVEPGKDEADAQGGTPNGEEPYQMDPI